MHAVHFHDVRRWANTFYFSEQAKKISSVVKTIAQYGLLDPTGYEQLLSLLAESPLPGFPPNFSAPSLSYLFELLGKNWLGGRTIDSYIHILSQQLNQFFLNLILLLDCYFHLELSNAYDNDRLTP